MLAESLTFIWHFDMDILFQQQNHRRKFYRVTEVSTVTATNASIGCSTSDPAPWESTGRGHSAWALLPMWETQMQF